MAGKYVLDKYAWWSVYPYTLEYCTYMHILDNPPFNLLLCHDGYSACSPHVMSSAKTLYAQSPPLQLDFVHAISPIPCPYSMSSTGGRAVCAIGLFSGESNSASESSSVSSMTAGSAGLSPCATGS